MSRGRWAGDLAMGARFAFTGGREGWIRALLTGVGVGLGVALLLLTAAVPSILDTRHQREAARQDYLLAPAKMPAADDTVVVAHTDTVWHDQDVRGRLLQPEGAKAPLPPGIDRLPAAGEMYVSPALADLLKSPGTALLRERLPGKVVGTIGESGLIGSRELAYYGGSEHLAPLIGKGAVQRINHFGDTSDQGSEPLDPVLLLLVLMVFVVLLTPVAIFVATAVRFGGEQRDRRLAALRLVGCDGGMARRIAAGEALAGSVLGLAFGVGFFLAGAQLAGSIELFDISIFPDYLTPSPVLALLVAVAVPATAVLVTLFSLRRVVIEPLGVVRTSGPGRRRLWWRLLLPLLGLLMLAPMIGKGNSGGDFNPYLVTFGVLALLVGITTLLPWVVERAVHRLHGGSVSWQLAVRRLQLSSGTAARMVNGIAVAVAGAIALQMLFSGVDADYTKSTGKDPSRTQLEVDLRATTAPDATARTLRETRGVRQTVALSETWFGARPAGTEDTIQIMVGDCAALRELARISACHDGDVFISSDAFSDPASRKLMTPGHTVWVDPTYPGSTKGIEARWTLPAELGRAQVRKDALRSDLTGLLVTPSALPAKARPSLTSSVYVLLDPKVPESDATEEVRTAVQTVDPLADVSIWQSTQRSTRFDTIRTGLFAGAAAVLALIGASLLVSQLEQLRERKKLLSSLIAFGTRRRTLTLSVLWQTAIPITLGLLLAMAVGLTLGGVLMKMTAVPLRVDWPSVLSMTGFGAAIVLAVTLLSLPPLLRLMRPDGLRTE